MKVRHSARSVVAGALLLSIALSPIPAFAEEDPQGPRPSDAPAAPTTDQEVEIRYGVPMVIADAVVVGLTVGVTYMLENCDPAPGEHCGDFFLFTLPLGFLAYVAAGPIMHAVNHNARRALPSLGLRLSLPIALGIVGGRVRGDAFSGLVLGLAAATLIDAVFLAKRTERVPVATAAIPFLAPTDGGMTAGLSGRF